MTDAAFAASTAHAAPLDDLLEPVAGDPYASRPVEEANDFIVSDSADSA